MEARKKAAGYELRSKKTAREDNRLLKWGGR